MKKGRNGEKGKEKKKKEKKEGDNHAHFFLFSFFNLKNSQPFGLSSMTHSPRVSAAGKSLVQCIQTTWAKEGIASW